MPRQDLGLPVLLAAREPFLTQVDPNTLSKKDRERYSLMTAENVDDPVVQAITSQLTDEWLDESNPLRPKIFVGTWTDEEGVVLDAYLSFRATGGDEVHPGDLLGPIITVGTDAGHPPKQLSLDKDMHKGLEWKLKELNPRRFTRGPRSEALRLTDKFSRERAWKRTLLRVWAAKFPDTLISLTHEDETLEERYGIEEPFEWWTKFVGTPNDFDLSDQLVYKLVAEGYSLSNWFEPPEPSLEVLQAAQKSAVEEGKVIDNTAIFRRWENSQVSGTRMDDEGEEEVAPSLDERRAAQVLQRANAALFDVHSEAPPVTREEDLMSEDDQEMIVYEGEEEGIEGARTDGAANGDGEEQVVYTGGHDDDEGVGGGHEYQNQPEDDKVVSSGSDHRSINEGLWLPEPGPDAGPNLLERVGIFGKIRR